MEAFKIDDVRKAIKDLNYFFYKIDMVELKDMPNLYESKNLKRPDVNSWVRVKTGLYQGDLAQV